jgi:hypothetical protein
VKAFIHSEPTNNGVVLIGLPSLELFLCASPCPLSVNICAPPSLLYFWRWTYIVSADGCAVWPTGNRASDCLYTRTISQNHETRIVADVGGIIDDGVLTG